MIKKRPIRIGLWCAAGILALLALAAGVRFFFFDETYWLDAMRAKNFKRDMIEAVSSAKRIEILEHSYMYDFVEGDEDAPVIVYKRHELTTDQARSLKSVLETMSDEPKMVHYMCAFAPHHTIVFHLSNGEKSRVNICFQCDDTMWNGNEVLPPHDFQPVIRDFIEPMGFQAERDWRALAESASTKEPSQD